MDYLAQQLTTLYKPEELASLGLSIYTTQDPQVQIAAENALRKELSRLENKAAALRRKSSDKKLQGAVVVMQPKTCHVLDRRHLKIEHLISPSKAFMITSLLRSVVENGTDTWKQRNQLAGRRKNRYDQ